MITRVELFHQPAKNLQERLPQGLSFAVEQPLVTLIGPNGSGKSALLRIIHTAVSTKRNYEEAKGFAEFAASNPTLGLLTLEEHLRDDRWLQEQLRTSFARTSLFESINRDTKDSELRKGSIAYYEQRHVTDCLSQLSESDLKGYYVLGREDKERFERLTRVLFPRFERGSGRARPRVEKWLGRILPGIPLATINEVNQACAAHFAQAQEWKYARCELTHPSATYLARIMPSEPFETHKGPSEESTKDNYFTFYEQGGAYGWTRNESSGQGVRERLDGIDTQIQRFFAEHKAPTLWEQDEWYNKLGEARSKGQQKSYEEEQIPSEFHSHSSLIVLMDEPTTCLDYRAKKKFANTLDDYTKQHPGRLQFWIATHDPILIERKATTALNFYNAPITVSQNGFVE